jgi:hypothetical protein
MHTPSTTAPEQSIEYVIPSETIDRIFEANIAVIRAQRPPVAVAVVPVVAEVKLSRRAQKLMRNEERLAFNELVWHPRHVR